jgi:hypothetical protein
LLKCEAFLYGHSKNIVLKKGFFMKRINHLLRFYLFVLSFALLVAPLPLSAIAQEIVVDISHYEEDIIAQNPDASYVDLSKEMSKIAKIVSQLSDLDEQPDSLLHELNEHIKNGFSFAEYDAIIETLEYADLFLSQNRSKLDAAQAQKIATDLDDIIDNVTNGSLTRRPTLVIVENIDVHGKATFEKHLRTKQGIHCSGKLKVGKKATFKKGVNIQGTLSVTDLVIVDCMNNLCVNNLSVVDESVSGTLSVNDAYIINGTIENLTITTTVLDSIINHLTVTGVLSANDAIIQDLTVANCMTSLCVINLSGVDESVSGTLSVNDEIVQNSTITNLSLTDAIITSTTITNLSASDEFVTNLSATDATITTLSSTDVIITNATINNLSVTDCISNLCVINVSVVDESVSGTLSVNDEIVQNSTITNLSLTDAIVTSTTITNLSASDEFVTNLSATDATITTLSSTDSVIANLTVTNCIVDLCVNNLSVTDEVIQTFLRFKDSGVNYVGLQAPTTVPTSYTISLPTTVPTAHQFLQANATTPTNLEWVTTGGSVLPANSKTIYVAKYGNDITGDGSFNTPYASLAKAIIVANAIASAINPICILISSGIYTENNSVGPLTITANGVSIVGNSPTSTTIMPSTPANDLLLINTTTRVADITLQSSSPLATGLSLTSGNLSTFTNLRLINFLNGVLCAGGTAQLYGFNACLFIANTTGLNINDSRAEIIGCSFFGAPTIAAPAANTGISMTGAGANVIVDGGACGKCNIGFNITGNATVTISAMAFKFNIFDIIQSGASHMVLTGSSFELTNGGSDIDMQISGAGTIAEIIGCQFNGNSPLGVPEGQCLIVSDNATVYIDSGSIKNYTTALQVGISTDASSTRLSTSGLTISNCTNDVIQEGSATLNFNAGTASNSKIIINDPTNISLAFFDLDSKDALTIGSTADINTTLLQVGIDGISDPTINYLSSLYSTQAVGFTNLLPNPSSSFVISLDNANFTAITTDRTDIAGLRLVSDAGSPVGVTSALRGWDINKNATSAELSFSYQNSDVVGQAIIPQYTLMQLDGVNNQLQLPIVGTQIVFDSDTNLYRSSANVLKTDDNFIVDTLTPGRVVITDSITNQLASSVTTSTELSFLSGVTSPIQTQLNGKVSKSGDTMTGTLTLPAGSIVTPSLEFSGSSTGTGLSAPTMDVISFDSNGTEIMNVSSSGVTIDAFGMGVVHSNSVGLLSSSLIVNGDITNATISNAKLATISSADIPGDIVVRDGSGNFAVNEITIDGTVTNPTDAATKAYVDAAIAAGIVPHTPARVVSVTDIGSPPAGLQTIDGVTLVDGDRVLLTGQSNPVENGLWVAHVGNWTRPADFANGAQAGPAYVLILEGAIYEGSSWLCTTPTAIIGTDPIFFELFTLPNTTMGANVGTGTGLVFRNKTGVTLNFRTLLEGDAYTIITTGADTVSIGTDATSANTPNTIVARDGSGNFAASTITANLTGAASDNVLKTGDTMTGTLVVPAGSAAIPSLQFTGSTNTGLSAAVVNTLSLDSNGTEIMNVSPSGVAIDAFSTAGVVHNSAAGLLTSSLIVNADVDPAAGIVDTKLATISTPGKVANSATTATSLNTPNTIVLRDGSGNFNAGTIVASLQGAASLNVLKAGDTMTGTLQLPAGSTTAPSLTFTGSTTTGLSASAGDLSFSTNGIERMAISSGGVVSIDAFTVPGVVHNDTSGNLSSSLIVDADVSPTANISDTKLATISTAGKVANSATTATSVNTPNTIVLRDASGSFSAGTITANLNGNATTATTSTNFSGSLSGEVTGTQNATVVSNAVSTNTPNAIVRRTATGGFSAGAISVTDEVISSTLTITPFTIAGVVHNDATGLLSSSLIVNADVSTSAAIVDTKLATISTAGKVSNSATTATSVNNPNTIVLRDSTGSFAAQVISMVDSVQSGNLILSTEPSTATAGNIIKGSSRFVHDFGTNNLFVGINAGNFTTSGTGNNVGIGTSALTANGTGASNTAVGSSALAANTVGINNTAMGNNALLVNTTGTDNTAIGFNALAANATGTSNNTAVGSSALAANTTGTFNVAVGKSALAANTVGINNTAMGNNALAVNTTGTDNTAIGFNALAANAAGTSQNTAVGSSALATNITGTNNTAIGYQALTIGTQGNFNTAIGALALSKTASNGGAFNNTAVGYKAMYGSNVSFPFQGQSNTAIGYQSMMTGINPTFNTAVGYNTLGAITNGQHNIAIGDSAGGTLTTGSNNIHINASGGTATESTTTRIGTSQTRVFIAGIRGVTTGNADAVPVLVDSAGQLGVTSSSRRYKHDIADMDDDSSAILNLRPVIFAYNSDASETKQYGLIAEEVDEVFPGIVVRDNDGQIETVQYHVLPVLLLNEVQKQHAIINDLQKKCAHFDTFEQRIKNLEDNYPAA